MGEAPKYRDFSDPFVEHDNQILIRVKAASVKNLDKGRASGAHYAKHINLPEVVGVDGVGILDDGIRVYASGLTGMIAEKAIIDKNKYTVLPEQIDDIAAAALPNAVMGAALALKYRGEMKPGDTVLINGATGVTGQAAVQIAKYYGAGKIIVTGRNEASLEQLPGLGADEVLSLKWEDAVFIDRLKVIHGQSPIDIVIDYTWGHPAEMILNALKGGGLHAITNKVRFVTVGSMAGEEIRLGSGILRSSAIEILGSGIGSLPKEAIEQQHSSLLPEMMMLAAKGGLKIDTVIRELQDIESAWMEDIPAGQRLVITIP
ncbi:alcohol dehydrogenase [Pedobacter sp. HMWF019]|nr:zinc-binding alcohol dehydrogenase family protein [Pedobacter sp. HMWF019]PTS94588.1 alcohol dehydrogenase [Pedobacter sp. HMWF019]